MADAAPRSGRVAAIDTVKGLATLAVILIHAKPFTDSLFHTYVIDRAVPVFVVLFGCNAEMWSTARADLRGWTTGRLRRLLPAYWATVTLWWCLAKGLDAYGRPRGVRYAVATVLGYAPWIQPLWFATLVVQLVLFWPLLRWLALRLGVVPAALGCLAIQAVAVAWMAGVIDLVSTVTLSRGPLSFLAFENNWSGIYYFVTFSPVFFWHVVSGMALVRYGLLAPSRRVVALAVVLVALGAATAEMAGHARLASSIKWAVDPALTVLLLGAATTVLTRLPRLEDALGWLGRWSWGVYLAHVLVHQAQGMSGPGLENSPDFAVRALYAMALLASGCLLARVATAAWNRVPFLPASLRTA